jgi:hypothetical protein
MVGDFVKKKIWFFVVNGIFLILFLLSIPKRNNVANPLICFYIYF